MKVNLIMTILFLVMVQALTAQRYSFKKPKGSFGLIIGSEYGSRQLSHVTTSANTTDKQIRYKEPSQIRTNSIRIGANYSKFLTNFTYLRTGLRFSSPGYYSAYLTSVDPELSQAFIEEREAVRFQDRYNFKLREYKIEVPLAVRYHFMTDKCAVFVEGGVSAEILLASTFRKDVKHCNVESVPTTDADLMNFFALLAVGSEWEAYDTLPLFVQMTIRYNPFTYDLGPALAREFVVGIELGTRKYF